MHHSAYPRRRDGEPVRGLVDKVGVRTDRRTDVLMRRVGRLSTSDIDGDEHHIAAFTGTIDETRGNRPAACSPYFVRGFAGKRKKQTLRQPLVTPSRRENIGIISAPRASRGERPGRRSCCQTESRSSDQQQRASRCLEGQRESIGWSPVYPALATTPSGQVAANQAGVALREPARGSDRRELLRRHRRRLRSRLQSRIAHAGPGACRRRGLIGLHAWPDATGRSLGTRCRQRHQPTSRRHAEPSCRQEGCSRATRGGR